MKIQSIIVVLSISFLCNALACHSSNQDSKKRNDSNSEGEVDMNSYTDFLSVDTTNGQIMFLLDPRKAIQPRLGDFDMMMNNRIIRILVPYSRTLFFIDRGRERGITAENARDFELYLNRKYAKTLKNRPIAIGIFPTPRDKLISNLQKGLGDIAAGNLTATEKRLQEADFFAPDDLFKDTLSEIILTNKKETIPNRLEDFSGKKIHVRKSSSYYEHLALVNNKFKEAGLKPIEIIPVSELLEDEDLMEMLDAGIISTIVVDNWMANMWSQILPNIQVNESISVFSGGYTGWAYRKNSPLLESEINDFYRNYVKANGMVTYRFKKYGENVKQLQNPTTKENWQRYQNTIEYFEKYGRQYGFDPVLLAALGFQESKLDQGARSGVGAIGVMQLMPATGKSMKVGDINRAEANIHAGTKYISTLLYEYFKDANFDEFNRTLFAIAAYNAGPARIASIRKLASERGYNPNLWSKNVEMIVAEKIGRETTTYVMNILKYYFSYKLANQLEKARRKVRESF